MLCAMYLAQGIPWGFMTIGEFHVELVQKPAIIRGHVRLVASHLQDVTCRSQDV